MSDKDKKKNNDHGGPPHEGSISATDPALVEWLRTFWARGEDPQRLEVWQTFGRNGQVMGQQIHVVDFKPNDPQDPERATKLGNEIVKTAQYDTDCRKLPSTYLIKIVDTHRGADPIARRIGPLNPVQTYLEKIGKGGAGSGSLGGSPFNEDEDEDLPLNGKTISLSYAREAFDQVRWEKQLLFRVLGQIIEEQREDKKDLRANNMQLMQNHMNFFMQLQDALDRSKQRDREGAWTDLKVELARDGARYGRNLVAGFFGPRADKNAPKLPGTKGVLNGFKDKIAAQIDKNSERSLIDGFLNDVQKAGLLDQLFGEWTEQGPVLDKPGIFTPEQVAVLIKVRDGDLPVEAVDEIIPGFGGKFEISFEQIAKAQPLIPEGMGQALLELRDLRERRRDVAAASPATPTASAER